MWKIWSGAHRVPLQGNEWNGPRRGRRRHKVQRRCPRRRLFVFFWLLPSVTSAVHDAGRGFPTSAGRSVADKVLGTILPLSTLAALGLEHIVASLYYLLRAWMLAWFVPE